MKRLIFIVLWTAIFFVVIAAAWRLAWNWPVIASLHQDFVDRIELFSYATYFAMPVLGLFLGLFGKLPGTEFAKRPE